jgi:hypothetical protein
MSRRLGVARSFFYYFLQYVPIQRQIGYQSLQTGILVTKLPQLAHFQDTQVRVALLPDVERRLTDPNLPTYVGDCLARIRLLERK